MLDAEPMIVFAAQRGRYGADAPRTRPGKPTIDLTSADRKFNTMGTELIPIDGIVKETSDKIAAGKKTEIDKVHAIYEWVVENTFRDA